MISVIIPTYNEAEALNQLLPYLYDCCREKLVQIIVADASSTDDTESICKKFGATYLCCTDKCRSKQMNAGAALAISDVLYFVHADTIPPADFTVKVMNEISRGYKAGRFKTKFDSPSILLKINAFFTRFDWMMCYGGDQTLFVDQQTFKALNGFNETLAIMEDYDFTERLKLKVPYVIMKGYALVSARKYKLNSWWAVQSANYNAVKAYRQKSDSHEIKKAYYSRLKSHS